MNKIPSFTINHEKLLPGIYVSRKDEIGSDTVTTFDIRMKAPNREPALHAGALHTIEHLAATYLRNDEEWKDRIVYWGPMGCLTGNYLLVKGDYESKDLVELMKRTFRFVASFEGEIPAISIKRKLPDAQVDIYDGAHHGTGHRCKISRTSRPSSLTRPPNGNRATARISNPPDSPS